MLGNYLQIPVGAGEGNSYPFFMQEFLERFKINPIECIHALKFIESQGLISFNENSFIPSRLLFTASREDVYDFELKNPAFELLIKTILRSYGGAFSDFVHIFENELASRCAMKLEDVKKALTHLNKNNIISYHPASDQPQIYFLEGRHHPERLPLSIKDYNERKNESEKRFKAMLKYASEKNECRSRFLIRYFGENGVPDCGICDVCIENKKREKGTNTLDKDLVRINEMVKQGIYTINEMIQHISGDPEEFIRNVRRLADEGRIEIIQNDQIHVR
jgi:ATP-dependent DNA helicase RecQ